MLNSIEHGIYMLIKVKMQTIFDILTFISMVKTTECEGEKILYGLAF